MKNLDKPINRCCKTLSLTLFSKTAFTLFLFSFFFTLQSKATFLTSIHGTNTCGTSNSGGASVFASGGTGTYSYHWASSGTGATDVSTQTGSSITGVAVGTYSVTVTDQAGQMAASSVVVTNTVNNFTVNPDVAICPGGFTQLTASGADIYSWSPATGLSNVNIGNPVASPSATTTYTVTGYKSTGNLVFNGDFSQNNIGFTSGYAYVSPAANSASAGGNSGLNPEAAYAVDVDAHTYHFRFWGLDHTTGNGSFMIVNGAPTPNVGVWNQTVNNVVPNTVYYFSTWISSLNNIDAVANLKFSINGSLIGPVINSPGDSLNWIQFYVAWNSGSNTSAAISIVNENIIAYGNDFGLDDISFTTVCPATQQVTVSVSPLNVDAGADQTICAYQLATLTVNGAGTNGTYSWSTGATTQSITASPAEATTYFVTATDAGGCSGADSVTVFVPLDTIFPVAVCRNDVVVYLNETGNAQLRPEDVDGGSTDNCTTVVLGITVEEFDCTNLGNNDLIFAVSDASGNTSSCETSVLVADTTSPAALCKDTVLYLDASGNLMLSPSDIDGGSTDNCAITSMSVTPASFTSANVGQNLVTLTVADASGNSSSCTAVVTVLQSCVPLTSGGVIGYDESRCGSFTPSTIVSVVDPSGGTGVIEYVWLYNYINVPNNGNSGWIVIPGANGATYSPGQITQTTYYLRCARRHGCATFYDGESNTVAKIVSNTPPVAVCKNATLVLNASGQAVLSASAINNGSTAACGIASTTISKTSFNCSNAGANTVTLTITDSSGNTVSCNATVTVTDTTRPVAICKNKTIYLNGNGVATLTANDINNGSYDNCGVVSKTASKTSFNCSNTGGNSVTLTVTDAAGKSSSCTSTVTVVDNTPPVAICKNITVALNNNGSATITALQIDNCSYDNCGITIRTISKTTFSCSDKGNNSVVLTLKDAAGNTSVCTATVTVVDNTKPVAICKNKTVALVNGTATISVSDINNGSYDNCGVVSKTISKSTFNCSNIGANSVILTVKDASGNTSTCTSTVTVTGQALTCSIVSLPTGGCQNTGGNPNNLFIGYGAQSTKLQVSVNGSGPYTYSWTPSTRLSCTTCASPTFTPNAAGNYTYTVTVSNGSGCTTTCSITICVLDIRVPTNGCGGNSGKVYVCHIPPGNPGNPQTISVSINAVSAHVPLHGGDHLGKCSQHCAGSFKDEQELEEEVIGELITDETGNGFEMVVYPNPFTNQFNIRVESKTTENLNVRVFDIAGKLMSETQNLSSTDEFASGSELAKGVYFVEVRQDDFKKVIRIVKQ